MANKKVFYAGPAKQITYANKVYKRNEDEMSVSEEFIKHHEKGMHGGHQFTVVAEAPEESKEESKKESKTPAKE